MGCGKSKHADVEEPGKKGKRGKNKGGKKGKGKGKGNDKEGDSSSKTTSPRQPPITPMPAPNRTITDDMKMTILVLGGPGSGKASLSKRLEEEFNMLHVCIGDLLRDEVAKGTGIGKQIADTMKEGKLVPSDIPLNLLNSTVKANSKKNKIVIDGLPKNLEQAKTIESQYPFDLIIYLDCTVDKLEERLLLRADHSNRSDDNTETIAKRLEHHTTEYLKMMEYFEAKYPYHIKKIKSGALQKVEVFLEASTTLKQMFGLEAKSALTHKKHDCTKNEYLFIMGGPGCGKGTQCNFLVNEYGYTHISSGDLLRNEVKSGTAVGKEVDKLMKAGKLVPLSITFGLLQNAFNASKCKHFLVDGFPRSLEQAQEFEKKFGKPTSVLYLSCSTTTMEKRIMERGKTSGRADDNPATIKLRLETFVKDSKPVIDYYKASGHLKEVSAEKAPDVVFTAIKQVIKN